MGVTGDKGCKGDPLTEFRQSMRKVELPSFNGEDPVGWISRAEVYFRVLDTSPEVKSALLERYGGNGEGDVYEHLSSCQSCIRKGYFLHGLKEEIRGKVRSLVAMGGMTRAKLLQVTRAVEREVRGDGGSGLNRHSRSGGLGHKPNTSRSGHIGGSNWVFVKGAQEQGNTSGDKGSGPAKTGQSGGRRNGPRDRGFSHLTYAEILDRKQKGICFKCAGSFHPMHKCPDKHLRVLIVEDVEEEFEENKIMAVEADPIDHLIVRQHKELQVVLRKHEAVFAEVVGLPPNWGREHTINIKVGEGPVNVRPYRYPYLHKNEIEKQVQEMLEAGIVKHSTSAYSSPVILVKKKDHTWRMCIHYRALNKGVAVDPNKYNSVLNWTVPRNVKGVRGFLGLTGYYRKFIRDYGKLAKPLIELTKKDVFQWGEEAQRAFDLLKQKLIAAPILALPNFEKEFVIECDASGTDLGAILSQEKKPIAYFSKALGVRNLAKSAYEKELMACVLAIQHWRPYLLGRKFVVSTDQRSLKDLLQQKIISGELGSKTFGL
ncbi:hypothetical protein KIW84_073340 [Lathyrus oleraceus]|uniref:Reverse transcriptase/retrotransposon-derived protein RNase H-like domain-containing protein n=1 Tax=Pisum sativum TaxID=3888 RepID=A0A9D4VP63_PEA|nr:hypothetical protein KIW84_073340 [Pisum sativum]